MQGRQAPRQVVSVTKLDFSSIRRNPDISTVTVNQLSTLSRPSVEIALEVYALSFGRILTHEADRLCLGSSNYTNGSRLDTHYKGFPFALIRSSILGEHDGSRLIV